MNDQQITVLWADDEIDLLKPQILFLENRGYNLIPVTNGQDAIEQCNEADIDLVILDESMPGLTGLETLTRIKEVHNSLPIIMVTKNEEENLMEEAIGSQISDYLIKPVKPQQILSSIKKLTDHKRLVSEKTNSAYQREFQSLFMSLQSDMDHRQWVELYKKLVYWELELNKSETQQMQQVFNMQKSEANREFNRFVIDNYKDWIQNPEDADSPVMSHNLLKHHVFDLLKEDKPTFLVVIDNLRFDQYKMIQPILGEYFKQTSEDAFYSILPTATQYSRNSIFSGLMPLQIQDHFPEYWKNDEDEGGKNLFESQLLTALLDRTFHDEIKHHYVKVTNHRNAQELNNNVHNLFHNKLVVIVYNFVDMLSHARTEMEVLKELAADESAYRSLTLSWFEHSPLHEALKKIAEKDVNLVVTTDHGTIRVNRPSKCVGDRKTSSNIRYKTGKNLTYEAKDVFAVTKPHDIQLPKANMSSSYIFAKEDNYLVYPNNYNYYVNYFGDTFQHGGISLEEMIIPVAKFISR